MTKCTFAAHETLFLGHKISDKGLQVDSRKIDAVATWPTPHDVKTLRSFLGMAGYFRKFIHHYADRVSVLTALLRKSKIWQWTNQCQQAFEWVKLALQQAPVLALPDLSKSFEVVTDASQEALGGILMQKNDMDVLHPVAYESRKLTPAERNYTTGEQELLAVVHALKTWRCYLMGAIPPVTVRTDHMPLTYLPSKEALSGRQARWVEFLSRFHLEWVHTKGVTNPADAFSRVVYAIRERSRDETSEGQESFLSRLKEALPHDSWINQDDNRHLWLSRDGVRWVDGRLYVPEEGTLRHDVLRHCHENRYAGHQGIARTKELVSRLYFWPRLFSDVKIFVEQCRSCQVNKPTNQRPAGLLQSLPIPEKAWGSMTMDFITHLPLTRHGNDTIVVMVDRLTKVTRLAPAKETIDAPGVARIVMHEVIRHYGAPKEIITDRDTRFMSKFWKCLCELLDIKHKSSTAYHPQTDGQTERHNRTLEEYLRHYVNPMCNDWDEYLDTAELAMNGAHNSSIKTTPNFMLYGHEIDIPMMSELPGSPCPAAHAMGTTWHDRLARAKSAIAAAHEHQKRYYDQRRTPIEFAVGDDVLLSTRHIRLPHTPARSLMPRAIGTV